jgi:hypothetical protein
MVRGQVLKNTMQCTKYFEFEMFFSKEINRDQRPAF